MADPLSIVASSLAVIGATGKTLQGIEKAWESRHRDQEFAGIYNQTKSLRILLWSMEIALRHIQDKSEDFEPIRDCLDNIKRLCGDTIEVYRSLDSVIQELRSDITTQNNGTTLYKPPMRKWIHRKNRLTHLLEQVTAALQTLAAALRLLQGVRDSHVADQLFTRLEMYLEATSMENRTVVVGGLVEDSLREDPAVTEYQAGMISDRVIAADSPNNSAVIKPYQHSVSESRRSSMLSFHTGASNYCSSSAPLLPTIERSETDTCKDFCPCDCHSMRKWAKRIWGAVAFYSNGSLFLNRRPCNKKLCRRSGAARMQLYFTFCAFNVYLRAESLRGFAVDFPRVIPNDATVFSIVEMGNIVQLRKMLSQRTASPYDMTREGISLLNYAVRRGQPEAYACLRSEKADPYFRDDSGMMAVQPGIDRALCGGMMQADGSDYNSIADDPFVNSEALEQQEFSLLHLIILGLRDDDLGQTLRILEYSDGDVDVVDINGRTPLLWAAWKGDAAAVELLITHGADFDKKDIEGFTSLAKAASACHIECVRRLLRAGAFIDTANSWGSQPIHLASNNQAKGYEIVEELLRCGADVNAYSLDCGTPLHNAANRGSAKTVEYLCSQGANVEATDEAGITPAMIALLCWNENVFISLVKAGARLDVVGKDAVDNILHYATWCGSPDAWNLIVEYAERDRLGDIGIRALHDGHDIAHCFKECRDLWYSGTRDTEEWSVFKKLLEAFDSEVAVSEA